MGAWLVASLWRGAVVWLIVVAVAYGLGATYAAVARNWGKWRAWVWNNVLYANPWGERWLIRSLSRDWPRLKESPWYARPRLENLKARLERHHYPFNRARAWADARLAELPAEPDTSW